MRGLTLLCLAGFILAAWWPDGGTTPLPAESETNKKQLHNEWHPLGNAAGFPPLPGEENKTDKLNSSIPLTNATMLPIQPNSTETEMTI